MPAVLLHAITFEDKQALAVKILVDVEVAAVAAETVIRPVESDIQPGGVSGGYFDSRMASHPSVCILRKCGNIPRSIKGCSTRKVSPSTPKMTVRIV